MRESAIILISSLMIGSCGAPVLDPFELLRQAAPVIIAPETQDKFTEAVPNSYIVVFRTAPGNNRLHFSNYYSEYKFHYLRLAERFLADPRVQDIQFLSAIDLAKPTSFAVQQELMMPRALTLRWGEQQRDSIVGAMARVDFASRSAGIAALTEWSSLGELWFAEPNWLSHLSQATDGGTENPPVNDGSFKSLADSYGRDAGNWLVPMRIKEGFRYIADQIAAGTLNEQAIRDNAPVVAVMDSGVDYEHPALKDQIWQNESEGQAECLGDTNGCDTTVNRKGWLGDGNSIHPFGVAGAGEKCPEDDGSPDTQRIIGNCRHGTHVAGIVAGKISGDVPGICPVCKIMVIKVVSAASSKTGGIPDSAILNGLRYVTRFIRDGTNVVRVVNASLGKFQRARAVTLLVSQLAHTGAGTLVVGAAGNEDTNTRQYPAANSEALAVASIAAEADGRGKKARYSNFGPWVDIAAPGGIDQSRILSTFPGGLIGPDQGTSMASPMVAGVAGMLLAVDPSIQAQDLRAILVTSADSAIYENPDNERFYHPPVQADGSQIPLLGAGTVDLLAALNRETNGLAIEQYLNSRVVAGCGIITGDTGVPSGNENVVLLVFLLVPLVALRFARTTA